MSNLSSASRTLRAVEVVGPADFVRTAGHVRPTPYVNDVEINALNKEMTMTRQHLVPYVNFQGRAREAMEFYQRVLGGSLQMYAAGEQGRPRPAEPGDRVMYARLEADGLVIVASDGNPSYPATVGDHIGLQIGGTDEAWLRAVFDGLADGGQVKMPLTKQPWGTAGWLADRFGINWNVDIETH